MRHFNKLAGALLCTTAFLSVNIAMPAQAATTTQTSLCTGLTAAQLHMIIDYYTNAINKASSPTEKQLLGNARQRFLDMLAALERGDCNSPPPPSPPPQSPPPSSPPPPPPPPPGSPPPPPPPPPAACHPATGQATVNPGNFASALASLSGSRTIVLTPGSYPVVHLSGKNFAGATIQCAQPGQCNFRSENTLSNVRGLTIDGIATRGGEHGITITASQDVTVRCSSFTEQAKTGVLLNPSRSTNRITIENNVFSNITTGCQYPDKDKCSGHLSDGSPVANMDYGVRVHGGTNIYIRGNTFGSLFNHAISLKEQAGYVLIDRNLFNSCGRTCIQLGQEPNTVPKGYRSVSEAMVTNNILRGTALLGIFVQNIEKVTMDGNTNTVSGRKLSIPNNYGACKANTGGCPLLGTGFPANRTIINKQ